MSRFGTSNDLNMQKAVTIMCSRKEKKCFLCSHDENVVQSTNKKITFRKPFFIMQFDDKGIK